MNNRNAIEVRMYLDVQDFHNKFELPSFNSFANMPDDLIGFRERFLVEEATETYNAMVRKDRPESLDGLIDLAYVAMGTFYLAGGSVHLVAKHEYKRKFGALSLYNLCQGVSIQRNFSELWRMLDIVFGCRAMAMDFGWFFDTGWDRVQTANMSKIRAKSDKDGKRGSTWDVVKPEGWVAPSMEDLV